MRWFLPRCGGDAALRDVARQTDESLSAAHCSLFCGPRLDHHGLQTWELLDMAFFTFIHFLDKFLNIHNLFITKCLLSQRINVRSTYKIVSGVQESRELGIDHEYILKFYFVALEFIRDQALVSWKTVFFLGYIIFYRFKIQHCQSKDWVIVMPSKIKIDLIN